MFKTFRTNFIQKARNPANIVYLIVYTGISILGILLTKTATKTAWQSLGIGLIGSGICGHISFLYLVASEDIKEKIEIISKYDFIKALPSRSVTIQKEYNDLLEKMEQRLDILAYGLSKFYDDHVNNGDLSKWSRNVNIRILLIDPEYPTPENSLARQRDKEERTTDGKIKGQVDEFLTKVTPILTDSTRAF